jgi:RNA polymerase sigma factor (sigma-70 family)
MPLRLQITSSSRQFDHTSPSIILFKNTANLLTLKPYLWEKGMAYEIVRGCTARLQTEVGTPQKKSNGGVQEERRFVSRSESLDDPRTDEELMAEFVGGRLTDGGRSTDAAAAAFDTLYIRFKSRVRSFHAIRWPAEVEEMTQETFIRAIRYADRFDPGRGSVRTWIYKLAGSAQKDYCRRHLLKWAKVSLFDDIVGSDERGLRDFEPMRPDSRPDNVIRMRQLIERLPVVDREIIYLSMEGHTDQEIAEVLTARQVLSLQAKGIATRRRRAMKYLGTSETPNE